MYLHSVLPLALLAVQHVTASPAPQGQGAGGKGLNELAKDRGLQFFGTAVRDQRLDDAPYINGLSNIKEFGLLVSENAMKVH